MALKARLIETVETADTLGEGVLWRVSDRSVWWTDIQARRLHRLAWPSLALETYTTPERLGSFGFVAGRDDLLIAAFESGFAVYAPESGHVTWLYRPAGLGPGVRLNDGRTDPQGRFWAGSMMERPVEEGEQPGGALYRLSAEGQAEAMLRGIRISNGLCWSAEGDRIYFADSPLGEIRSAPFDANSGTFGEFETFARFKGEAPDGAVTDAEGCVWTALWGGGRVARISPAGEEIASVEIDAPQPTCPAFGGPDANLLFVVSARDGLTAEQLKAQPLSGALFVFETDVCGWPQASVRLAATVLQQIGMEAA